MKLVSAMSVVIVQRRRKIVPTVFVLQTMHLHWETRRPEHRYALEQDAPEVLLPVAVTREPGSRGAQAVRAPVVAARQLGSREARVVQAPVVAAVAALTVAAPAHRVKNQAWEAAAEQEAA